MSSLALSFNNVQFDIIDRNNQPWIKSRELAKALGYADEKSINRIYQRNADEFTPNMVGGVNLTTPSGEQETRIFSLRGCHLLAMFARTTIAKQFRKWVLDILDKEVQKPVSNDHDLIAQTLNQLSNGNKKLYMSMYNGLVRRFKVGRLSDIAVADINKAVATAYTLALEWHNKNNPTALKINDGEHYIVAKNGVVIWEKVLKPHCNDLPSNTLKNPALMVEHIREVVGEFVGKGALPAPKQENKFDALKKELEHFFAPEDPRLEIAFPTAQHTLSMLAAILVTLERHGLNMALMYQKTNFVRDLLVSYWSRLDSISGQLNEVNRLVNGIGYAASVQKHPSIVSTHGIRYS